MESARTANGLLELLVLLHGGWACHLVEVVVGQPDGVWTTATCVVRVLKLVAMHARWVL